MKRLVLDKLRREKGYTWVALGDAVDIPFRTLQDIAKRGYKQDATQIASGSRRRLEKVCKFWQIDYEDLFENVDESAKAQNSYNELDDLDDIVMDMQDFSASQNGNIPEFAKDFLEQLNQTPFIFKGDIRALLFEFLTVEAEINNIKKELVFELFRLCKKYAGENEKIEIEIEKGIRNLVRKIKDDNFPIRIKTLKNFAIAMHQYEYIDAANSLFEVANRRLMALLDN